MTSSRVELSDLIDVETVHMIADRVEPRYRAMVLLGAATGMRQGELRGLTVDRLTFAPDRLIVRIDRQLIKPNISGRAPVFGPPKTEAGVRTLTVRGEIVDVMRQHVDAFPPGPAGIIFTGRSGRGRVRPGRVAPLPASQAKAIGRPTMASIWQRATVGLDMRERSGWHDLRHFCVSALINGGASLPQVSAWIGHKDQAETLKTYSHFWPSQNEQLSIALDALIFAPRPGSNVLQLPPR